MEQNKKSMAVSIIILVVVIGLLVYFTINNKWKPVDEGVTGTGQKSTRNIQQVEGVKITVLKEGSGDEAKSGDMVAMNYTGHLADGTVFDSNVDPKFNHVQPFVFTIGSGQVIKGWDVGVAGMKVGERRILEIAPEYAYGTVGAGGVIPPNATISFEVELLQIKK